MTAVVTPASQHLSQLCKGSDVQQVMMKLQAQVDDPSAAINWQDDDGRTAFHWAIGLRSWDLATALMDEPLNAEVITADKDGMTPLMSACAVDAPSTLLDLLIERYRCASMLECTDSAGNTALILASSKGNALAVRRLLTAGASLGHQNKRGQSALHRAVSRGMTDTVEELLSFAKKLERSAKVKLMNLADVEGNTPLHYAAMENNQELGQLLIRNGASREAANKQGKVFWEL